MKPPHPPQREANRVEDLVEALQKEGRVENLEKALVALDPSSLSPAEQEAWWRMYGIAAFQARREAEATQRFEEAYRRFPGSARIRFSLGQQYVRAGAPDRGFELFRGCSFPDIPREYALMQARCAYLCSRYADGLAFLRPFYEAYKAVRVLDDHFLYVRGLPFFGTWWRHLAAFCVLSGDLRELESMTRVVIGNCHDYDFEYLQAELNACRDDRPGQLLPLLEKRLGEGDEDHAGYTRLTIAVIKARVAPTLEEAHELLAAVALSAQDDAWLEDVRTLAFAEAARRFGDTALEERHAAAFLARQPMLLEPDVALNFQLLGYQENLKARAVID